MHESLINVRVRSISYEATDVLSFGLAPLDGAVLPPVDPGAHVDVHLPNGLVRSYSLSNGIETASGLYRLTVAREAGGKGGSLWLHDSLRAGQTLHISAPRNNFSLAESAALSIFIAGGIGVTPLLPMMVRLNALAKPWKLYYCAKNRDRAAHLDEIARIAEMGCGEVETHFSASPGGNRLDVAAVLAHVPPEAHVYCCGPVSMLETFGAGAAAAGIATERTHREYFVNDTESATEGGFTVELKKSNRTINIQPGKTILHAVLEAGIDVAYSCEDGVCGSCETRVLAGTPDHRDKILSEAERAAGKSMMICCSGAKSPRLVLDL